MLCLACTMPIVVSGANCLTATQKSKQTKQRSQNKQLKLKQKQQKQQKGTKILTAGVLLLMQWKQKGDLFVSNGAVMGSSPAGAGRG